MTVIAKYAWGLICITAFISTVYVVQPFTFGLGDNVEELPLIFKQLHIAEYDQDIFITSHSEKYSAVTPYIFTVATIVKIFSFLDISQLFLAMHIALLILFYLSIRLILSSLAPTNEFQAFLCAFIIVVIHVLKEYFMPEGSGIFVNKLDPTFVAGVLFGLSLAFLLQKKPVIFLLLSLCGTLMHPLYGILLLPGFASIFTARLWMHKLSKFECISFVSYAALVAGYSFFIWHGSRSTTLSSIDIAAIYEMHLPLHNVLPKLFTNWREIINFYIFSIGGIAIGIYLLFYTSRSKICTSKERDTYLEIALFATSLILMLLLLSGINELYRIPTLIIMKPYRIGGYIVIASWILLYVHLIRHIRFEKVILRTFSLGLLVTSVITLTHESKQAKLISTEVSDAQEMMQWILKHTNSSDLFMYYGIFENGSGNDDIRTHALRPMYVNFDTLPLTVDDQINWYQRLLIQWDLPTQTMPHELLQYHWNTHSIDLKNVLKNCNCSPQYVLTLNTHLDMLKQNFSDPIAKNNTYSVFTVL